MAPMAADVLHNTNPWPIEALAESVERVRPGAWAVGVSGGADSVALLRLLAGRVDLRLHVVHLDHQMRGDASTEDARFVAELARSLGLPCALATRAEVAAETNPDARSANANLSAQLRELRLALYRRVCDENVLLGVILAHHADDQAETIFQRLLRGAGPSGLVGMRLESIIGGLRVLRPLLEVSRTALRAYLADIGQFWREDESNASSAYQRNRVRRLLQLHQGLSQHLLDMGGAMRALSDWARDAAPVLGDSFAAAALADQPEILAAEAARRWLIDRGVPHESLSPEGVGHLLEMARDAASAPRRHFPGKVWVGRRKGMIAVLSQ